MILVTGDLHGHHEINKLINWRDGAFLHKTDYLIILGDFGLIWDISKSGSQEKRLLQWLNDQPWTTLFIDGNHENFDRLFHLPQIEKFNGTVGMIDNSIFHLRRGQIYSIEEHSFFCFGGARSIDKNNRREFMSWWKEEEPSYQEYELGFKNLAAYGNKVDYILTHTAPTSIIEKIPGMFNYEPYALTKYLEMIYTTINFKQWLCGHFHLDMTIEKINLLFGSIVKIGG